MDPITPLASCEGQGSVDGYARAGGKGCRDGSRRSPKTIVESVSGPPRDVRGGSRRHQVAEMVELAYIFDAWQKGHAPRTSIFLEITPQGKTKRIPNIGIDK